MYEVNLTIRLYFSTFYIVQMEFYDRVMKYRNLREILLANHGQ